MKLNFLNKELEKIVRIEVIDENGRSYQNFVVEHLELHIQDIGSTLKLFVKSNPEATYKDWEQHFNQLSDIKGK